MGTPQSLHPSWSSDASFLMFTARGQRLVDCTLYIETFDTEKDGTATSAGHRLTDFLGSVKLQGSDLERFVEADEIAWCDELYTSHRLAINQLL